MSSKLAYAENSAGDVSNIVLVSLAYGLSHPDKNKYLRRATASEIQEYVKARRDGLIREIAFLVSRLEAVNAITAPQPVTEAPDNGAL